MEECKPNISSWLKLPLLPFNRPRATSSDSPRSSLDTPASSLGELVPPGSSPVAPKSPDPEMSSFPLRVDGNEMSLEEEQLANASNKSK